MIAKDQLDQSGHILDKGQVRQGLVRPVRAYSRQGTGNTQGLVRPLQAYPEKRIGKKRIGWARMKTRMNPVRTDRTACESIISFS